MKVLSATLLVLALTIAGAAQRMTDRDIHGLSGKVKRVQIWKQKYGSDGKPIGKPQLETDTTYDDQGNNVTKIFGPENGGELRINYFLLDGDRVSTSEPPPEGKSDPPKPPGNFSSQAKKKGPYDTKYSYVYDDRGRIIEINESGYKDSKGNKFKYDYDRSGRMASAIITSDLVKTVNSFKYDDAGNLIETLLKIEISIPRNKVVTAKGPITPPRGSSFTGSGSTITRFSDYVNDLKGNWIKRTAMDVNNKGEVEKVSVEVREITYF